MPTTWRLHPDRALPTDPTTRSLARGLLAQTQDLPIVSMHGHVDIAMLERNEPFSDPAEVFVIPDHYLVRMLVSQGVPHDALGVPRRDGGSVETDPRAIWRTFAAHWHLFRGTPTRFWLEHVFIDVFGITERLSAETADAAYDTITEQLAQPEFAPLALLDRFDIEILATTDSAEDDLDSHRRLAERGYDGRLVPTFRPDSLLHVDRPDWSERVRLLGERSGIDVTDYQRFIEALEARRRSFIEAGARASDHGHQSADTTPLDESGAARIFARALAGEATAAEAQAFGGHMLSEMARMSCDDGLVMQLHPGVVRNYDPRVFAERGPDVGYDIPAPTDYVHALQPLLTRYGHHPDFTLVLFTVDEDSFSRELAPLAGVFPALRLGAPWWFLDTPDAMRRYREAVTDTAGFYNTAGFVDDTRAYFSIPARHDLARRIDAGHLARLVAEHRLDLDEAEELARLLAYDQIKTLYPELRG